MDCSNHFFVSARGSRNRCSTDQKKKIYASGELPPCALIRDLRNPKHSKKRFQDFRRSDVLLT